jgi:hypothetical protein
MQPTTHELGKAYSKGAKRSRKKLSVAKRRAGVRLPQANGHLAQVEQELERREAERAGRHEHVHVLNRLARRDRRSVNERQRQAGMAYHDLHLAAQHTVVSQLDPGRRAGATGNPFPLARLEACADAAQQLKSARAAVGAPLRAVLDPVVIDGFGPQIVASRRSQAAGRAISAKLVLELLRTALDALADHFERVSR